MTLEYLSRRAFLKIRELVAEGVPQTDVAAELHLQEGTVAAVVADQLQPSRIVVDDDHPLREEMLTATRCAGCGALVFAWPCLGCQMQQGQATVRGGRVTGKLLKQKCYRIRAKGKRPRQLPRTDAA